MSDPTVSTEENQEIVLTEEEREKASQKAQEIIKGCHEDDNGKKVQYFRVKLEQILNGEETDNVKLEIFEEVLKNDKILEYLLEEHECTHKITNKTIEYRGIDHLLVKAVSENCLPVVRHLLKKGANVNEKDADGNAPLHAACKKDNLEVVKYLVENGANVNAEDVYKNAPLHCACEEGHLPVAEYLISKGAEIEAKNDDRQTPLHWACLNGHLLIVQYLIEKQNAEIEAKDSLEETPLYWACEEGQLPVVEYLISKGAKIEAKNWREQTPLYLACEQYMICDTDDRNSLQDIIKKLVELGATIPLQLLNGLEKAEHQSLYDYLKPKQLEQQKQRIKGIADSINTNNGTTEEQITEQLKNLFNDAKKYNTVVVEAINSEIGKVLLEAANKGYIELTEFILSELEKYSAYDLSWHRTDDENNNILFNVCQQCVKDNKNKDSWKTIAERLIKLRAPAPSILPDGLDPVSKAFFNELFKLKETQVEDNSMESLESDDEGNGFLEAEFSGAADGSDRGTSDEYSDRGTSDEYSDRGTSDEYSDTDQEEDDSLEEDYNEEEENEVEIKVSTSDNDTSDNEKEQQKIASQKAQEIINGCCGNNDEEKVEYFKGELEQILEDKRYNNNVKLEIFKKVVEGYEKQNFLTEEVTEEVTEETTEEITVRKIKLTAINHFLVFAAYAGCLQVVNYLIKKEANVDAQDIYKSTPLHYACMYGHLDIVKYLVGKGANVDAQDIYKSTPLHYACENGHLPVVKYLIEKKCVNINVENRDGETPLYYACFKKNILMILYLISKGADTEVEVKIDTQEKAFPYDFFDGTIKDYLIAFAEQQKILNGLKNNNGPKIKEQKAKALDSQIKILKEIEKAAVAAEAVKAVKAVSKVQKEKAEAEVAKKEAEKKVEAAIEKVEATKKAVAEAEKRAEEAEKRAEEAEKRAEEAEKEVVEAEKRVKEALEAVSKAASEVQEKMKKTTVAEAKKRAEEAKKRAEEAKKRAEEAEKRAEEAEKEVIEALEAVSKAASEVQEEMKKATVAEAVAATKAAEAEAKAQEELKNITQDLKQLEQLQKKLEEEYKKEKTDLKNLNQRQKLEQNASQTPKRQEEEKKPDSAQKHDENEQSDQQPDQQPEAEAQPTTEPKKEEENQKSESDPKKSEKSASDSESELNSKKSNKEEEEKKPTSSSESEKSESESNSKKPKKEGQQPKEEEEEKNQETSAQGAEEPESPSKSEQPKKGNQQLEEEEEEKKEQNQEENIATTRTITIPKQNKKPESAPATHDSKKQQPDQDQKPKQSTKSAGYSTNGIEKKPKSSSKGNNNDENSDSESKSKSDLESEKPTSKPKKETSAHAEEDNTANGNNKENENSENTASASSSKSDSDPKKSEKPDSDSESEKKEGDKNSKKPESEKPSSKNGNNTSNKENKNSENAAPTPQSQSDSSRTMPDSLKSSIEKPKPFKSTKLLTKLFDTELTPTPAANQVATDDNSTVSTAKTLSDLLFGTINQETINSPKSSTETTTPSPRPFFAVTLSYNEQYQNETPISGQDLKTESALLKAIIGKQKEVGDLLSSQISKQDIEEQDKRLQLDLIQDNGSLSFNIALSNDNNGDVPNKTSKDTQTNYQLIALLSDDKNIQISLPVKVFKDKDEFITYYEHNDEKLRKTSETILENIKSIKQSSRSSTEPASQDQLPKPLPDAFKTGIAETCDPLLTENEEQKTTSVENVENFKSIVEDWINYFIYRIEQCKETITKPYNSGQKEISSEENDLTKAIINHNFALIEKFGLSIALLSNISEVADNINPDLLGKLVGEVNKVVVALDTDLQSLHDPIVKAAPEVEGELNKIKQNKTLAIESKNLNNAAGDLNTSQPKPQPEINS